MLARVQYGERLLEKGEVVTMLPLDGQELVERGLAVKVPYDVERAVVVLGEHATTAPQREVLH